MTCALGDDLRDTRPVNNGSDIHPGDEGVYVNSLQHGIDVHPLQQCIDIDVVENHVDVNDVHHPFAGATSHTGEEAAATVVGSCLRIDVEIDYWLWIWLGHEGNASPPAPSIG